MEFAPMSEIVVQHKRIFIFRSCRKRPGIRRRNRSKEESPARWAAGVTPAPSEKTRKSAQRIFSRLRNRRANGCPVLRKCVPAAMAAPANGGRP